MSYNIDTVKQKKLDNLTIPVSAFYTPTIRTDWKPDQPKIINFETNEISINMGCGQTITGILKDGNIHVTKMNLAGEGSGSLMHYLLTDVFKQSTGSYEAIMIWEGGDSVTKFTIENGVVTETPHEL